MGSNKQSYIACRQLDRYSSYGACGQGSGIRVITSNNEISCSGESSEIKLERKATGKLIFS
jgi:hypothetical protein